MKSLFPFLGNFANLIIVSLEYVSPVGFECLGTQMIPLTLLSFETISSTLSIFGPFPVKGTGIMFIPISSNKAKCLSYPGTGHITEIFFLFFHGPSPLPLKKSVCNINAVRLKLLVPLATIFFGLISSRKDPIFFADGSPSISP